MFKAYPGLEGGWSRHEVGRDWSENVRYGGAAHELYSAQNLMDRSKSIKMLE